MYDCPICGEFLALHPQLDSARPLKPLSCPKCGSRLHRRDFFLDISLLVFFTLIGVVVVTYTDLIGFSRLGALFAFGLLYVITKYLLVKHFFRTRLVLTTNRAVLIARVLIIAFFGSIIGIWIYALTMASSNA